MDEKELERLYNAVNSKFDIGDYNTFRTRMQTPEDRKKFYDVVGSKGFDLGEYPFYEERLSGVKKKPVSEDGSTVSANGVSKSPATKDPLQEALDARSRQRKEGAVGNISMPRNASDATATNLQQKTEMIDDNVLNRQSEASLKKENEEFKQQALETTAKRSKRTKEEVKKDVDEGKLILSSDGKGNKIYARQPGAGETFIRGLSSSINSLADAGTIAAVKATGSPEELAALYEMIALRKKQEAEKEFSLEDITNPLKSLPSNEVITDLPTAAPGVVGTLTEMGGALAPDIAMAMGTGGLSTAAKTSIIGSKMYASSYGNKAYELYEQGKQELMKSGMDESQASVLAAKAATENAATAAIPDAAMNTLFFSGKLHSPAANNFISVMKGAAKDAVRVGGLGAATSGITSAIESNQGYDIGNIIDKMVESGGEFAKLDLLFKVLPILRTLPKAAQSAVKEFAVDPVVNPVVESYLKSVPEDIANRIRVELQDYKSATEPVRGVVPEEKMASLGGRMQKRQNRINGINIIKGDIEALEAKKKDLPETLHEEINTTIKEREGQIKELEKEIESVDKEIGEINKSKETGLEKEIDEATGEPLIPKEEPTPPKEVSTVSESEVDNTALKDIESTAMALEGYRWDEGLNDIQDAAGFIYADRKAMAEDYHAAKKDGSNPGLVNAVEKLLTPKQEAKPTVSSENPALSENEKVNRLVFDRESGKPLDGADEAMAEQLIEKAISKSKDTDQANAKLDQLGYNLRGQANADFNQFVQDRIDGKTDMTFSEWKNKNKSKTEAATVSSEGELTQRQLDNREKKRIEDIVESVEGGDIKGSSISVGDKDLVEYLIDAGMSGREAHVVKGEIEGLIKPLKRITDKIDPEELKFLTENVEDINSVMEGLEDAKMMAFSRNKDIVDGVNKEAKRLLDFYSDKSNLADNKLDTESTFAAKVDLLDKFLKGELNYLDLSKFGVEKKAKDYFKPKIKQVKKLTQSKEPSTPVSEGKTKVEDEVIEKPVEGNERQQAEEIPPTKAEPIEVSEGGGEPPKGEEPKVAEGSDGRGDFDKMMAEIPQGKGEVKEYLSGETINRDTSRKTENDQSYTEVKLLEAAQHGQDIVEKAKEIFGDKYVEETLSYLDKNNISPDVKALAYVSLENAMEARVTAEPNNLGLNKLQDLVREKSQAWLRKNSIAINAGRLRVLKEVGFDLRKVTDNFFSPKEREQKANIEKLVQADAETIQKEYEKITAEQRVEGITPEVEAAIKEGVEKEVNKIFEKLPKQRQVWANKAIAALEKFQKSYKGKAYDATGAIPLAIIDAGVTATKLAIKAGVKIADAIEIGIEKIKEKWGKDWEKEGVFRKDMAAFFEKEKITDKDLNVKQYVKDALIKEGFFREVSEKGKSEKRKILDWKKLAGEERSLDKISENVGKVIEKDTDLTKEQASALKKEFIDEYNSISERVIENGLNEIARLNKNQITPEQKSAAKRLSELYNYGLFDKKNLAEYEIVLNKALGISKLTGERVKRAEEIAKAMSTALNSTYQGKKVEQYQIRAAEQHIQELIRDEITAELSIASIREGGKIDRGKVFYKIADVVASYMDLSQMMLLNSVKNAVLENPISGYMENVFNKVANRGAAKGDVRSRMTNLGGAVLKEMITEKGAPYGDVTSTFVTRGSIERDLNKMTDNKAAQAVLSTVTGKTLLSGVDSYYKANNVERNFLYNLQKVLTQDRKIGNEVVKGMSKDEARNYIADRMSGQKYEQAQETAREIINNVNKSAGRKILNDSELFVTRMANDIIKGSLVTGGKVTSDMVTGSYEAAYEAAGRGLGHVANNIASRMIGSETGRIENKVKESLKNKDYSNAAFYRMYGILFKNILNPYVGGGMNWVFLTMERGGGGLVSGLGTMLKDRNARKMDLTTEAGINDMKKALYANQKIRDKFIRGAVGGSVGLITALVWGQIRNKDEYEEWREKNYWATKYTDILYPQVGQYFDAAERGDLIKQTEKNLNLSKQFDKGEIAWQAFKYAYEGKTDKAAGKLGQLNPFGAPVPWRLVRDVDQIVTGMAGGEPYKVPTGSPESFWEGWWRGGVVDYVGFAPKSESKGDGNNGMPPKTKKSIPGMPQKKEKKKYAQ